MSDRIGVMRGGTMVQEFPGGAGADAIMAAALGLNAKGAA
jgi:ABC-type sugar transport system ATPase subunit